MFLACTFIDRRILPHTVLEKINSLCTNLGPVAPMVYLSNMYIRMKNSPPLRHAVVLILTAWSPSHHHPSI
eukprot:scaffold26911_cov182-Skeletonema_dohrnii-CCMP3373.AAC.2